MAFFSFLLKVTNFLVVNSAGTSPCRGRVPVSYDQQESDTRTLTIIYQSLIITVTFILASIFLYFTIVLIRMTKKMTSSKQFVVVIGGMICFSFLARCIFFLIILSVDFVSSVYMFCVLFTTEVLMMFIVQLQMNLRNMRLFKGFMTRTTSKNSQSVQSSDSSDSKSASKSNVE
jgi:hypothetical protein